MKRTLLLAAAVSSLVGGSTPLAHSATQRSAAVVVAPANPTQTDTVFVAWRVPEGMDNNGDGYRVTFSGPGGADCSRTGRYGGGASWNLRYNKRYRHHRAKLGFPPMRSDGAPGPPALGTTWCIGTYTGKVVFTDYPAGRRHGLHHTSRSCDRQQVESGACRPTDRLVGRFSFVVR